MNHVHIPGASRDLARLTEHNCIGTNCLTAAAKERAQAQQAVAPQRSSSASTK